MIKNDYKVDVPEGVSGSWAVRRFAVELEESKALAIRAVINGHGRFVPAGTYTGLYRHNSIIMSDTPDEIRDHREFMRQAAGSILIAGLGLGMVLQGCAVKENVKMVTVVEESADVIALVQDHYKAKSFGEKITIIHADIFDWKPVKNTKFDYGWYDIWDNLCTDNLDEMTKLHRKFAKTVTTQGSWAKELLKARRRQERASPWY